MKALLKGLLILFCFPFIVIVTFLDYIRILGDDNLSPENLWTNKIETKIKNW